MVGLIIFTQRQIGLLKFFKKYFTISPPDVTRVQVLSSSTYSAPRTRVTQLL
jgi:hypothetical protein